MTFAFATLAFLVAAWAAVTILAATLENHWPAVARALAGRSATVPAPTPQWSLRMRVRYDGRRPVRMRSRPARRAAA